MAEPTKEQFGDGQDNFGLAASKAAEAARLFSEQAASKGTEMAVNSAAASVQAGLEGGSAVANIAAGTAAGGPWGAAISAAWSMRHTLYKILICICLFFTVIIVLVVALPSIVTESVFGLNGTQPDPNATLESSYTQMADAVSAAVEAGYDQSLAKVEQIIADGGYDYNLSMDAMINHAQSTAGYDVAYILAAYSASLQQKGTSVDDMVQKLQDVGDLMFPVTYVEKEQENLIPVSYCTYKPQTVTVVTAIQPAGVVNGVAKYNYTTEQRTYYIPDETLESDVELTIDSYRAITVTVPIYSGSKIAGVEQKTFYKENGTETISPTIEIIKYVECTIHPFDNTVIADAFGIDMSAEYPTFKITYLKNFGWHFARYGGVPYADEPLYCIEPHKDFAASTSGNSVDRDVTLSGSSSTTGSNVWYSLNANRRKAIGLILLYTNELWDHSISVTTTSKANNPNVPLRMAAQFLIFEIVCGLRDADTFVLNSTNESGTAGDIFYNAGTDAISYFAPNYNNLVSYVQAALEIPSFTSSSSGSAPVIQMNSEEISVYDSNGVLSDFSFTDKGGVEFYKSGNTLYITQTGTINESTVHTATKYIPSPEETTYNIWYMSGSTYGEAIQNMANALKMTLYGSLGSGSSIPLTDSELIGIVNQQTCNDTRKHILTTALSLVGKVPYFWGGKSAAGWNDEWNTPKLVTSAGSSSTGTIRPFGLDCSGFTDWVYKTALGISIQAGSWGQYTNSSPISEAELLPGDLGFLMNAQGTTSHVLIFVGYTESGARQWVHSESGTGVHVSTPRYDSELVLRRPNNVDFSQDVGTDAYGEPLYSLTVDVTHYCACTRCCGPNAQGITASGKRVAEGMVAMSSHYPFGTQIMINGVMYTVEDRGGSGIENDISRVDIFVPDHNYALRLGRFETTAYIYRIGR